MKKVFAMSLVLCGLFLFTGCGEKKLTEYEKTMKEYATNYYNMTLKGTEGTTAATITVGQLRKAAELNVINYDMTKLSSCTAESYVELAINTTNNEVSNVTYHMECGK